METDYSLPEAIDFARAYWTYGKPNNSPMAIANIRRMAGLPTENSEVGWSPEEKFLINALEQQGNISGYLQIHRIVSNLYQQMKDM